MVVPVVVLEQILTDLSRSELDPMSLRLVRVLEVVQVVLESQESVWLVSERHPVERLHFWRLQFV